MRDHPAVRIQRHVQADRAGHDGRDDVHPADVPVKRAAAREDVPAELQRPGHQRQRCRRGRAGISPTGARQAPRRAPRGRRRRRGHGTTSRTARRPRPERTAPTRASSPAGRVGVSLTPWRRVRSCRRRPCSRSSGGRSGWAAPRAAAPSKSRTWVRRPSAAHDRQLEHLVEVAVVERAVPADRQRVPAHEAGDGRRVEALRQELHVAGQVAALDQPLEEPVDRHVGERDEPVERHPPPPLQARLPLPLHRRWAPGR